MRKNKVYLGSKSHIVADSFTIQKVLEITSLFYDSNSSWKYFWLSTSLFFGNLFATHFERPSFSGTEFSSNRLSGANCRFEKKFFFSPFLSATATEIEKCFRVWVFRQLFWAAWATFLSSPKLKSNLLELACPSIKFCIVTLDPNIIKKHLILDKSSNLFSSQLQWTFVRRTWCPVRFVLAGNGYR